MADYKLLGGAFFIMRKFFKILLILIISVIVLVALTWALNYWYDNSALLQNTFGATNKPQAGIRVATDDPSQVETLLPNIGGKISLLIFTIVLLMQFVSLAIIAVVVRKITNTKGATLEQKEAAFKDADIFLDLPLYIGLFGSVSSFLLISFSPQSSRLVAYSSTLIGIIFSVCAKIGFLYPVKNKLLLEEIKKNK